MLTVSRLISGTRSVWKAEVTRAPIEGTQEKSPVNSEKLSRVEMDNGIREPERTWVPAKL